MDSELLYCSQYLPTSKIFCRMFPKAKRLVLLNTNKMWPCFVSAFYVPLFFLIWMWSFFVADIDGLGLDVPPGSPSSVRSSGDGSSCDTPPVNQCTSSTDDGRTDRGKYCDCCYCEFFGHAAVSRLFTSNQVTLFDFYVHVLKQRDGLRTGQNIFVLVWNEWIGKVDQIVPQTYF